MLLLLSDYVRKKVIFMYPEFFNDVFGPIMQPGSSSHTAGPCRLGYLTHCLLKGNLKKITIKLDPKGSFCGTFGIMFEDLGMLAGAYGLLPDDPRIFEIKDILKKEKIDYYFEKEHLDRADHPNAIMFVLENENGEKYSLLGNSTGGGMIETIEVMGLPYRYKGDRYVDDFPFKPVLPVTAGKENGSPLFTSMSEWRQIAKKENLTLAEAAVMYETQASGWTREDVVSYMKRLKSIMDRQTSAIYEEGLSPLAGKNGFHYKKWSDYTQRQSPLSGSLSADIIKHILGVQAQIPGVCMVPGPMGTGGGFMFSAIKAVAHKLDKSDKEIIDALFVAAGVGAICYLRSSPTGEITGCAGECGVCGAMTAAAITYLANGNPKEVENAASLSLQMALGWPCDPIPGGQNQPCFSRFITVIEMAVVFADLALSGRDAVIPFHEVVDVMDKMGRKMPTELKCTSRGGICDAPSAKRIKEQRETINTSKNGVP